MKKKLPPKPKVYDNVEKIDGTKRYGYVKEIVDNENVIIAWSDEIYPATIDEKCEIKSLAITRRL